MPSPETIREIQALTVASRASDLKTDFPFAILPDGQGKASLYGLEQFHRNRNRFRGIYRTNSTGDFVRYVEGRKGKPRGFIDAEKIDALSCSVLFNLGDEKEPGHADDIAILKPKALAAFTAVQKVNGQKMTQQQCIDWIEDWSHVLTATGTDGAYMSMAAAVAGIRHMKLVQKGERKSSVDNMSAARSAMEEIEAKSETTMPCYLTVRTEPFDRFKPRSFLLRVGVLTGGNDGAFTLVLRWQQQEHQCEEIAQEFKELLVSELGGLSDSLVVGTFDAGK